jgi:hypothetical protein
MRFPIINIEVAARVGMPGLASAARSLSAHTVPIEGWANQWANRPFVYIFLCQPSCSSL